MCQAVDVMDPMVKNTSKQILEVISDSAQGKAVESAR